MSPYVFRDHGVGRFHKTYEVILRSTGQSLGFAFKDVFGDGWWVQRNDREGPLLDSRREVAEWLEANR